MGNNNWDFPHDKENLQAAPEEASNAEWLWGGHWNTGAYRYPSYWEPGTQRVMLHGLNDPASFSYCMGAGAYGLYERNKANCSKKVVNGGNE